MTVTDGGEPVSSTFFEAAPSGRWNFVAEQKSDDLSSSDVVDDMVFDADGNLVMMATYAYRDGVKVGLRKEEYGYDDNKQKTRVLYAWSGDSWSRAVSTKVVAE